MTAAIVWYALGGLLTVGVAGWATRGEAESILAVVLSAVACAFVLGGKLRDWL